MIPEDILHLEILPWLSNKTLSRFKSVCKRWFHLITYDTAFAWQHLSHHGSIGFIYIHDRKIEFRPINILGKLDICKPVSSFLLDDMQSVSIVTSTNGLLLLKVKACRLFEKDTFYIWNLVTNEHNVIPQFCLNDYDMNVGLAYEPWVTPTNYKLVSLIVERQNEFYKFKFKMYFSNIKKWTISNQELNIQHKSIGHPCQLDILYRRGIIYWNCSPFILWFQPDKNISGYILSPTMENMSYQYIGMTDEGILTIVQGIYNHSSLIWMMNDDGEWIQRYVLPQINIMGNSLYFFLPFMGGDRIYLKLTVESMDWKIMLCYLNLTTGEIVKITEAEDYFGSLGIHIIKLQELKLNR